MGADKGPPTKKSQIAEPAYNVQPKDALLLGSGTAQDHQGCTGMLEGHWCWGSS